MKLMKRILLLALVGTAMCGGPAFGQGRGQGSGGGKGEESTPNNLSVPTIFVGSPDPASFQTKFGLRFPTEQGDSTAPPSNAKSPEASSALPPLGGYELPGEYYVQGTHQWQADSFVSNGVEPVFAKWGDNLVGDAKLKTGSPIRVEIGLTTTLPSGVAMTGWEVFKLEPSLLDRLSVYGTPALLTGPNTYASVPKPYNTDVRVYDLDARLKIYNVETPNNTIIDGSASAEINATGKVVYGYNLRVPTAGFYTIEFSAPNVMILGTDEEGVLLNDTTVALTIQVVPGGGKGGASR